MGLYIGIGLSVYTLWRLYYRNQIMKTKYIILYTYRPYQETLYKDILYIIKSFCKKNKFDCKNIKIDCKNNKLDRKTL